MSESRQISVLLVEDNKINMLGLKLRLQKIGGYKIVGEAYDGSQAVVQALALRPDVVLMDVGLPILNGIESCKKIKDEWPAARVVMLTLNDEPTVIKDCMKAGANSFCSKEIDNTRLSEAIRDAIEKSG